jgi:hypothetical protein
MPSAAYRSTPDVDAITPTNKSKPRRKNREIPVEFSLADASIASRSFFG